MAVLVDTTVWVEFFRSGKNLERLDFLLDENLVATNELVLTELVPFLRLRREKRVIDLLQAITRLPLKIDWRQLGEHQYQCLKAGLNGVGIPDLIIAQNALQHRCEIYTLDKHFTLLAEITGARVIC